MTVGVLGCCYGNPQWVDKVLEPWLSIPNVEICVVHGQFKEYKLDLGLPDTDSLTISKLLPYQNVIKVFFVHEMPEYAGKDLSEHEIRNIALRYLLEKNVDAIYILDGDEFYTEEQINNIISFVNRNEFIPYFKVNFKNYVFDGKQWIDGFCPNRLWRVKYKNLTLKELAWDNDIHYQDENGNIISDKQLPYLEIPRHLAHIKHMTWLHENGKIKEKYQRKHFDGICSYKFNNDTNKLEFDLEYYKVRNIPLPILNAD